ncbi:MAG TPA: hypothetical protein VK102_01965 [Sphingobacterium sp.]|nr:hypothetical protein [Sphingobacterium sp.]
MGLVKRSRHKFSISGTGNSGNLRLRRVVEEIVIRSRLFFNLNPNDRVFSRQTGHDDVNTLSTGGDNRRLFVVEINFDFGRIGSEVFPV